MKLDEGARFKGKLGMAVRKSVKVACGNRALGPIVASLPPDVRWFLTERYIATQWYPLRGADEMLEGIAEAISEAPAELARRIGRDVAHETAGRVGRTLVSIFGTPERMAKYLGPMWTQIYDGGHIDADYDAAQQLLTVRRSTWPAHRPLVCVTLLGSLEGLARQMGRPRLLSAARTSCISEGGARCQFELRFDDR